MFVEGEFIKKCTHTHTVFIIGLITRTIRSMYCLSAYALNQMDNALGTGELVAAYLHTPLHVGHHSPVRGHQLLAMHCINHINPYRATISRSRSSYSISCRARQSLTSSSANDRGRCVFVRCICVGRHVARSHTETAGAKCCLPSDATSQMAREIELVTSGQTAVY